MTISARGRKLKGANGEREFAAFAVEHGHPGARRHAAQGHGGSDEDPDVRGITGIHIEVKRVEKSASGDAYSWMDQATRDAGSSGRVPVVAHRRNNKPWLAILPMDQFLKFYRVYLQTLEF